jgi:hypothetical protein
MLPLTDAVNIPFHTQFLDDEGSVQANEVMEQAADVMLDELLRVQATLRPLRESVEQPA